MAKKKEKRGRQMPIMRPHSAGMDIGAEEIYVAVPCDHDEQPVRCFSTFTCDLHALAEWLQRCGIDTVAMESTGVYWIPIFQILESRGFEVFLVNGSLLEECARAQERRLRLPMDSVPSFGWSSASQLPPSGQSMRCPYVVAASSEFTPDGCRTHSAHAEIAQSHECAGPSCAE